MVYCVRSGLLSTESAGRLACAVLQPVDLTHPLSHQIRWQTIQISREPKGIGWCTDVQMGCAEIERNNAK